MVGSSAIRSSGATGERDGDQHALAHPARELVGELLDSRGGFGDPNCGKHLDGVFEDLVVESRPDPRYDFPNGVEPRVRPAAAVLVEAEALGDLLADGDGGVERGHRVLEDHTHLAAANPAHRVLGRAGEVDGPSARIGEVPTILVGERLSEVRVVELDAAVHDLPRGVDEAHRRERRHGLSRPGLTDETDGFALFDGQIEPVDGLHRPAVGGELGPQTGKREEVCHAAPFETGVYTSNARLTTESKRQPPDSFRFSSTERRPFGDSRMGTTFSPPGCTGRI